MNETIIDELSARLKELSAKTEQEIEDLRVKLLGKKGEITKLFEEFRTVPAEQKRLFGQRLNVLKNEAQQRLAALREALEGSDSAASGEDLTMPGDDMQLGARHPISITREEILSIYKKFGYSVAEGPEVEDDWHVFGALNFPPEHPARDMQDTFFINNQT
ncbi:MAG: phenylalanine--tRNA ligase subunit alpha, partial [Bacteroidales bacterium]|nr:phenylalanine--tRNA ligase subunit alpha [Bacteroidales bacterium]